MTLIKDLISIPERVNKGDFVLRLTEGVRDPGQTLDSYVVTDQLAKCFDHALMFIRSAVEGRTSKASYLHGSFGSGKSHFMAVLHLILQGHTGARSIPELAEVVAKHNAWMDGKKFLLVPYHMIGARNMESAILGGYADFVRRTHPESGLPGVFLAEKLFNDAASLRNRMGDDAFFAALGETSTNDEDGWGELGAGWNAERFDRAIAAPPGDDDRLRLVGDLVGSLFTSQHDIAKSSGEGYINLDDGLSVISRHAKGLGYDGVILFLDELILWLASHSADLGFVQLEGQKLAKLVEAQSADRPIPIVSFVARQRDLRDLVGKEVSGSAALNFSDILGHWEGRFDTLTLEDRNLPVIAHRRILSPKDDAAGKQMDAAFEQTAKVREDVLNTLLTSEGDRAMFRRVYPFSPALVQTLIAVSSLLQRERTALKVMLQLLVNQRASLQLGDVVPVGDLFDVIAHGEEAFSEEMRIQFDNAKRLYHGKLLPLLENQHGKRREELEKLPFDDPARINFRNEDRLLKTLLLSALAPGVESLRALTATRLAALNHGTIKSPIPGREGQMVAQRVKKWAGEIGEIKVGEEANPSISVQLTGVDTESIIDQARREDNEGNRIRHIRETLFDQLGIKEEDTFFIEHSFFWRNTRRTCEVVYGNIRTLPDSSFIPNSDEWKLIIDFPFDEHPHGPMDDVGKLQEIQQAHPNGLKTLAWVPSFFSIPSKKRLGRLVILEHILTGDRYRQYSTHLSPQDRASAKALLENQRSQLRQRVKNDLIAAYGLDSASDDAIDAAHELTDHFQSLMPGFDPRPPVAPNLKSAMEDLLGQALIHQFPAHPAFETEIKTASLNKVLDVARQAARTPDGRVPVDKSIRTVVRQIANPLQLGEMAETHFVLGRHWKTHFNRKASEAGGTITIRQLREWIDQPAPMGLPEAVGNLLILAYAETTDRSICFHGVPFEGTLTNLKTEMELREQVLPEESVWNAAVSRAGSIFGVTVSPLRNAANAAALASGVKEKASRWKTDCRDLNSRLRKRLPAFGIDADAAPRMKTATASLTLATPLATTESDAAIIETLADARVDTSETAMGHCLSAAGELVRRMDSTEWRVFDAGSEADPAIQAIRDEVAEALEADEHVRQLGSILKDAQSRAIAILTHKPKGKIDPPPKPPQPPKPPKPPVKTRRIVDQGQREELDAPSVQSLLTELEKKMTPDRTLKVNLNWVIEEGGNE